MYRAKLAGGKTPRAVALLLTLGLLAGCEEGEGMSFLQPKDAAAEDTAEGAPQSTTLVERDVEAPEVFQVTEAGLWDGRPSLGGVWVAHPDVTDPERVIIRNTANNKFVIGALFRREREIPGPRIQASSDAAAALGMLAGAPVQLNITALRRESVAPEPAPEPEPTVIPEPEPTVVETPAVSSTNETEIDESALGPMAAAAAAIDAAAPTAPAAAAPAKPKPSSLSKPYIQIGIFSVKANADRTANQMRSAGMIPTVRKQSAKNKPFWRVLVGPAQSRSELNTLLKKVKETGFSDAYAVTN